MKTYGVSRKVSLKKYGLDYETIDFHVEGCESFEEAKKEITEQLLIMDASIRQALEKQKQELEEKKKLEELNKEPFSGDEFKK